jgi:mRNA-degrading endonuclease RelE of RelBE toxin-antitoxin system
MSIVSRALSYVPLENQSFRLQLEALDKSVQKEISEAIQTIVRKNPYCKRLPQRECRLLRYPLDGIRRIHVGSEYCVAYVICEECRKDFEEKFGCFDCYKRNSYHIKLISCGPRIGFYKNVEKNYGTWLYNVESQEFIKGQE